MEDALGQGDESGRKRGSSSWYFDDEAYFGAMRAQLHEVAARDPAAGVEGCNGPPPDPEAR